MMAVVVSAEHKRLDRLFFVMLVAAAIAGMGLSLASAGYLLAFNVNTLMISAMIFSLTGAVYWIKARGWRMQLPYTALATLPIALRLLLNMPIFQSYTPEAASFSVLQQVTFTVQVVGLWLVVAVCEEAFRATVMATTGLMLPQNMAPWLKLATKITVANVLWILFHFIQRPFDLAAYRLYVVWLFISGLLLGWMIEKVGLGCAALTHFLINLTA